MIATGSPFCSAGLNIADFKQTNRLVCIWMERLHDYFGDRAGGADVNADFNDSFYSFCNHAPGNVQWLPFSGGVAVAAA